MKKLLFGVLLLSMNLLSAAESVDSQSQDKCRVTIEYVFGVVGQDELTFVDSSAGPITTMKVSQIEKLLKVALNENGYGIETDGTSTDFIVKFNYFNLLNDDGTSFGGVELSLKGPNNSSSIRQTPGLYDQFFSSEGKQVRNTTKSAIADLGKYLSHCN